MDPSSMAVASNWVQLFRHCLFCASPTCQEPQCDAGREYIGKLVDQLVQAEVDGSDPLGGLLLHYTYCQVSFF